MLNWLSYFNKWSKKVSVSTQRILTNVLSTNFSWEQLICFVKISHVRVVERRQHFPNESPWRRCLPCTWTGGKHSGTVSMWDWGSETNASVRTHMLSTCEKSLCVTHCNISLMSATLGEKYGFLNPRIYPVQRNPCSDHEKEARGQQIPSSTSPVLRHCFFGGNGNGNCLCLYRLFFPLTKGCQVIEGKEVKDKKICICQALWQWFF